MLEWYRDSRSFAYQMTAITFGLAFVVMTLIAWDLSWMTDWVFWGFVLSGPVAIFVNMRRKWMAAGADWFSSNTGWVKIYELTEVELADSNVNPSLYLTDAEGRAAHADVCRIQANPRLWDLVYNGILHSIHTRKVKLNTRAQAQVIDPEFGWRPE